MNTWQILPERVDSWFNASTLAHLKEASRIFIEGIQSLKYKFQFTEPHRCVAIVCPQSVMGYRTYQTFFCESSSCQDLLRIIACKACKERVAAICESILSWQPIIFSASSHVHSKSHAQSHASSRGQSPDRSHDTSCDTSHDLPTQHWSRDMTSQSRRF